MAWETSLGVRSIRDSERRLFVSAAISLLESGRNTWVRVYDQMDSEVKAGMLVGVIEHLVDPLLEPPTLTASLEGTVGAVFAHLSQEVETECCLNEDRKWRTLIRAMGVKVGVLSTNVDAWMSGIRDIADAILWDRDFEMENLSDAPPDHSRRIKERLGIDQDYYITPPPFNMDVEEAKKRLQELLV
jgi:hypothetical protein